MLLTAMACLLLLAAHAQADKPSYFKYQFTLQSDNDFYLAQYSDRYYTEGLFFNLSWAGRDTAHKKISSLELGQLMFNPYDYRQFGTETIDRPYAGFLFFSAKQTRFLAQDRLLQLGATIGITGRPSLAEALQKWYHHMAGFKRPNGWQYQVKTEPGINLHALYAATLFPSKANTGIFAVKPVAELIAGNSFTNLQAGAIFQLGAFEQNSKSALWNAGISRAAAVTRRRHECFLYFHPQLTVQLYNTTIEGGLFRHDKGLTRPLETLVPLFTLGGMYAHNHFVFGVAYVYQSRETPAQRIAQQYGSLQVGYRF